jgi:hypothetical protein
MQFGVFRFTVPAWVYWVLFLKSKCLKAKGGTNKSYRGTYAPQEEGSHPASLDIDRHQDRFDQIVSNDILTIREVHGKTLDLRVCLSSVDIFIIRIIAKKN